MNTDAKNPDQTFKSKKFIVDSMKSKRTLLFQNERGALLFVACVLFLPFGSEPEQCVTGKAAREAVY